MFVSLVSPPAGHCPVGGPRPPCSSNVVVSTKVLMRETGPTGIPSIVQWLGHGHEGLVPGHDQNKGHNGRAYIEGSPPNHYDRHNQDVQNGYYEVQE